MVNNTAWEGAIETVRYGVYLGVWTDWRVMGSTLTLSREDGNYLLSFTAFFIGLVSTRFWRILCFILHNSFSTSTPRDGFYHQQQAILRNSASPNSGLLVFCQLAWAWRKAARRACVRASPLIATASFSIVAFTIAGGFSSKISTGVGNEVLLDGSNCAFINIQDPGPGAQSILQPYQTRQANTATNYAQQCYSTNASGMFDCGTFVKPRMPGYIDNQTACPFAKGMCQSDANLRLDTGYIDSHENLGLNAPYGERVMFRSVLQCAPIVTEGYTSNISTSDGNYTIYNYGPRMGNNYTQMVSTSDSQYDRKGNEFKVISSLAWVVNGSTWDADDGFEPIPGLFSPDGDVMLTFLVANGVVFLETTADPWYRVNTPAPNITTRGMAYRMDEAASPMACLRQYQFCNPALPEAGRCGPLTGFVDAQLQAAPLFDITYDQMYDMTYDQMANNDFPQTPAAARYVWLQMLLSLQVPSPAALVDILGPNTLTSQQSLIRSSSSIGMIPSYQWQLDVQNWWAIHMASLQAATVNIAYGPHNPALEPYRILPRNSHVQNLCNNQKILSTKYASFSVFGICFIYVIGALIIGISLALESIQAWLYRHRNLKEYAYLEWTATETLQLQRMAYQGLESGHWSCYTDHIPLTEAGELLADLPRSYPLDEKKKKKKPEVERGSPAEKPTGTTVIAVQTSTPTPVDTDAGSTTPRNDNSQADMTGVGGRQSVEVDSSGTVLPDDSVQPPALPHMYSNPQLPPNAAPIEPEQPTPHWQGSGEPIATTPDSDQGTSRVSSRSSIEARSGN